MKTLLKQEIEKAAKEANCTEIEIITAMQGAMAMKGDEETLKVLCKIKSEYINKMF